MRATTIGSVTTVTTGIWREGLHELLWERRYGDDLVDINQAELAEQLQLTRANLNRNLKAMAEKGWIEQVDGTVYRVMEPALS